MTADPPSPHADSDASPEPKHPEDVSSGLVTWRQAVILATNPAQLALCLMQLDASVAWEKSIMKVVSTGLYKITNCKYDTLILYMLMYDCVCRNARFVRRMTMKRSYCCVTDVIKATIPIVLGSVSDYI